MDTNDLMALYQIALTADFKGSQVVQIAALFQRCEAALKAAALAASTPPKN